VASAASSAAGLSPEDAANGVGAAVVAGSAGGETVVVAVGKGELVVGASVVGGAVVGASVVGGAVLGSAVVGGASVEGVAGVPSGSAEVGVGVTAEVGG
jgi:hypothetical protein